MRKGLPFKPILHCRKKIGPGELSLITSIITVISGNDINNSILPNRISMNLFNTFIKPGNDMNFTVFAIIFAHHATANLRNYCVKGKKRQQRIGAIFL